jgi:uncharacterized protein YgiM (DUF1202 family)
VKKSQKTILVVFLLFTLFCSTSVVCAQTVTGYINKDDINMNAQPSADSKVIHVFKKGDRIVYDTTTDVKDPNSWIEVSITRSKEHGYVLAKYVTDGAPQSQF